MVHVSSSVGHSPRLNIEGLIERGESFALHLVQEIGEVEIMQR
jgi:hypothetical protein